eukprot:m.224485 g.224485  ORF g.224485 m.224485 type:complete len:441 (-) comp25879_c0_seq1:3517-4839(-)
MICARRMVVVTVVLLGSAVVNAEFFCSPIWGNHPTRGPNNGNPRYRVSARTPQDVVNMNARFNTCHQNCNATEDRFIWFLYSNRSYPFIMDGTCPSPTETSNVTTYNMVDLDNAVGNGTDFRCGHHRGIGHDAGYYSFILEFCLSKIGTLNAFATAPIGPPQPTPQPTRMPTLMPTRVPSPMPTPQPSDSPTAVPTMHPCSNANTHNCGSGTQCRVTSGAGFTCACLVGFIPMPGSTTMCMSAPTTAPTNLPTMTPTSMPPTPNPTPAPTMDPCTLNTDQCDPVSSVCAPWSYAPWYSCICNIGYQYSPNIDPRFARSCDLITAAPTTLSPTLSSPPTLSPSPSQGGSSSGSSADDSAASLSNTNGLVVIILIVVIGAVIIGAVLYYKSSGGVSAGGGAGGGGVAAFSNPMYDESTSVTDGPKDGQDDAGGYMDVGVDDL